MGTVVVVGGGEGGVGSKKRHNDISHGYVTLV